MRVLLAASADQSIVFSNHSPLKLARVAGHADIVRLLEEASTREAEIEASTREAEIAEHAPLKGILEEEYSAIHKKCL